METLRKNTMDMLKMKTQRQGGTMSSVGGSVGSVGVTQLRKEPPNVKINKKTSRARKKRKKNKNKPDRTEMSGRTISNILTHT